MELKKLLETVETHPGLFIGSSDIRLLHAFLNGYVFAKNEEHKNYGDWLFRDFTEYLSTKYQDLRSFNWCCFIIEHEPDGNSTDAFFRLLHEFEGIHPIEQ